MLIAKKITMKLIYLYGLVTILFCNGRLCAQSSKAFYTNEELLSIPVEAAYFLKNKDDFALVQYLENHIGLKKDSDINEDNYYAYSQSLDGSLDFDTNTIFSLIVDKRGSDHSIKVLYLKTKKYDVVVDKSFFEYLNSHPKVVRNGNGFLLFVGDIKKDIKSQNVIIGILPDYFIEPLSYRIFIAKNDGILSLQEILKQLKY